MDNELLKSLVGLGGIAFIVALVQVFKPWVKDTRWYPPMAMAWGLAINLGLAYALGGMERLGLVKAIFLGLMAGLAASGLYSAGSTVMEGEMADKAKRSQGDAPPSPPRR